MIDLNDWTILNGLIQPVPTPHDVEAHRILFGQTAASLQKGA